MGQVEREPALPACEGVRMTTGAGDGALPDVVRSARLLVLVLTMDLPPFDAILREGARPTWMTTVAPGTAVVEYRGRPVPPRRLAWSGVRERLRLRGAHPVDPLFGDPSRPPIAVMNRLCAYAFAAPDSRPRWLARQGLRGAQGAIRVGEMLWTALGRHRLARCDHRDGVLHVDRVQTVGNMIDVQFPVFARLLRETDAEGFVVCTVSTYLDIGRALAWHESTRGAGIDFASMPQQFHKGRQFQGGCMYFSRSGLQQLVGNRAQVWGGMINDIAMTDWLTRTGRPWHDMPVLSLTGVTGVPVDCPMCADSSLIGVRCTQHGDRGAELARMRALHHDHSGHATSADPAAP